MAGPTCTRALADLGANVIKIEPPDGDLLRRAVPRVGGIAVAFTQQNVGKRFASIDIKKPGAVELLLRIASQCDVFVENFRGGVAKNLGVGFEAIKAVRPDVIYCSISGYGQTGSASNRRAYAPVVHAEAGLIHYKAEQRGTEPLPEPVSHADIAVGMQAAQGILAALFNRERTGEGTYIDACMAESMLFANEWTATEINGGVDWDKSIFRPGKAAIVQVGDGTWLQIPGSPAGTLPGIARLRNQPELLDDLRFDTLEHRNHHLEDCLEVIKRLVKEYPDFQSFEKAISNNMRLPVGEIISLSEVPNSEWAREREAFIEVSSGEKGETVLMNRGSLRFSNASFGPQNGGKKLGADNHTIMKEIIHATDEEIAGWDRQGLLAYETEEATKSPWT